MTVFRDIKFLAAGPASERSRSPAIQEGERLGGVKQRIGYVSLVVRDYDQAIAFYTKALGFDHIAGRDAPGYIDQSGAVISRTLGLARS